MKAKIVILSLLAFYSVNAQSPVYPVKDATVNLSLPNSDVLWFGYTPIKKTSTGFEIYYFGNNIRHFATSPTGTNWIFNSIVNTIAPEAIIKKDNIWYMGYHTRDIYNVYFNTTQSSDGINFPAGTQRFPSGEDMSMFVHNDSFYCYIRPQHPNLDPQRKIGLMKSKDFANWTPIKTILKIDPLSYDSVNSVDFRKQFYNMAVFRYGKDWWGLVNVYRVGNQGQDTDQMPPYVGLEHTVEPQLVYSRDGENWERTNNRAAFIPLNQGRMEIFGLPTLDSVNKKLWVYAIETDRRHTDYEYLTVNGRWFTMWRYGMSLDDLETWKNPTTLNLKVMIEGLYEGGRHKKKDTIDVLIKNSTFPYAVVDSARSVIDSVTFMSKVLLRNVTNGSYYIVVKGRNIVETWTRLPVSITRLQTLSYDFSTSSSQAYGNNLMLRGTKYCIYSGDVDKNRSIELSDILNTFNDAGNFSNFISSDVNGDGNVDLVDLNIIFNNAGKFVSSKHP